MGRGRRIKEITCHEHKIQLLISHHRGQTLDHCQPGLFEASTMIGIAHPGIGLADLPVRRVQKANQARNPKQR